MACKIEIETFGAGSAFHKPVDGLGRVRHLLGGGHHAFRRPKRGIRLFQNTGGPLEEFLARE